LISKENNFEDIHLSIVEFRPGAGMMADRIAYYKPIENTISFKYFDYLGGLLNFKNYQPTFQLYWEVFKGVLSYQRFFHSIQEVKYKPSIFLYLQLQQLSSLFAVNNQPINRLMN
jgi:hypothetical protein